MKSVNIASLIPLYDSICKTLCMLRKSSYNLLCIRFILWHLVNRSESQEERHKQSCLYVRENL